MTFNAYETSVAQGEPILLYDFSVGATHWRFTSADRTINYSGNSFAPAAITRTAPVQSNDIRQQTMTVTVPRDCPINTLFSGYAPAQDVLLVVTALHYDDPDQQGIVDWTGRVTASTWKNSQIDLSCEPIYTSMQTVGLRRKFGVMCPHVLYGPACGLTASSFAVSATLSAVSGVNVTSSGFVPGTGLSFLGGWIEWESAKGYLERRSITGLSGTTLTLNYGSPDLVNGLAVTAYPGCARNISSCNSFGNSLNYGGQQFIPSTNPMDGSFANPVY